MDIQDKAFKEWFATRYPNIQKTIDLHNNHESIVFRKNQAEAWQAAKAQAVPEGFVLVPKEPTDKTIAHMINTPIEVNLLCDHADVFLSEGEAYIAYQAMIAAQEPAND